MPDKAPIALALDAPNLEIMESWVRQTSPYLSCMKVGLETFLHSGRAATDIVRKYASENDLFLDLKLHDIPQTVANAASAIRDIAPEYLTVHASGGKQMVEAACLALPNTKIVAVTVLTSLDLADMSKFGVKDLTKLAIDLAVDSVSAGAKAIVCSPQEVAQIRGAVGTDVTLITPGVRPLGANSQDQKRTTTPQQALAQGSDLLVIGRPITQSDDIEKTAREIAQSLTIKR
jgi:orotidine-5'-phosphate decarboxylase